MFLAFFVNILRLHGCGIFGTLAYGRLITAVFFSCGDQITDASYFLTTPVDPEDSVSVIISSALFFFIVFAPAVQFVRGVQHFFSALRNNRFFDKDGQPTASFRAKFFLFDSHHTLFLVAIDAVWVVLQCGVFIPICLVIQSVLWSNGFFAWIPWATWWARVVGFAPFNAARQHRAGDMENLDEGTFNYARLFESVFESVPQFALQLANTYVRDEVTVSFIVSAVFSAFMIVDNMYQFAYQKVILGRSVYEMRFLEQNSTFDTIKDRVGKRRGDATATASPADTTTQKYGAASAASAHTQPNNAVSPTGVGDASFSILSPATAPKDFPAMAV